MQVAVEADLIDWFRSWHGAPTDPKWLVVARRANVAPGVVSAVVWALFDHASHAAERGTVDNFDFETYAAFSGFSETDVRAVFAALEVKGVVISGRLAQWEKRQPRREDSSAERTSKFRRQSAAQSVQPEPSAPAQVQTHPSADISDPARAPTPQGRGAAEPANPQLLNRAIELADEITVIAGHDPKFVPPTWCGAAARVQVWLDRGWDVPLILQSVRAQMVRKRDGPPGAVGYFEKGIAQAHAARDAPIPIVTPMKQEAVNAKAGNRGGFGVVARVLEGHADADRASDRSVPEPLRLIDGSRDP
jgi:hypothetical protein